MRGKPQISSISIQYAAIKTEKDLEAAINYVDSQQTGILTFEMLGKYLYFIGVFRVLFNPAYQITAHQDGTLSNSFQTNIPQFEERKYREKALLLQLWKLLAPEHPEYIEKAVALEFIKLVYEPDIRIEKVIAVVRAFFSALQPGKPHAPTNTITAQIKTHTSRSKSPSHGYNSDAWGTDKIVREFMKLNETRQRGDAFNFLKNIKPGLATTEYSFIPTINSNSREIDKLNNHSQMLGTNIEEAHSNTRNRNVRSLSGESPFALQNATYSSNDNLNRQIGSETRELDMSMSRHMMLYEKSKKKNMALEKMIRDKQRALMKECTFKPCITPMAAGIKSKGHAVMFSSSSRGCAKKAHMAKRRATMCRKGIRKSGNALLNLSCSRASNTRLRIRPLTRGGPA